MRLFVFLFIFTLSCTPYKRVKQLNMKNPKANRIAKKLKYTQPHKSYSDKSTWRRTFRVAGHGYHRTY